MLQRSSASRIGHPIFARVYARTSRGAELRGQASARQRLLFGLQGRVVEAGAGNGLNFAHYPTTVDEVVAIEPESSLRRLACVEAARTDVRVSVLDGTAEALPLEDASCDAAVASFSCAASPTKRSSLPSCDGCCAQADSFASTSTSSADGAP